MESSLHTTPIVNEQLEPRILLSGQGFDFPGVGAMEYAVGEAPASVTATDVDADGQPTGGADGDDLDGTDDEDGVTFTTLVAPSLTANADVLASGAGLLNAWIDFNGDGDWGGPFEQIADSVDVVEGDNAISFDVPASTISGVTYARFRLSTEGNLQPNGLRQAAIAMTISPIAPNSSS